jgi:hypothetical protein
MILYICVFTSVPSTTLLDQTTATNWAPTDEGLAAPVGDAAELELEVSLVPSCASNMLADHTKHQIN